MEWNFRRHLILHVLVKLEGDRTPGAVYHILTGKKSSQSIQDMKWYGLTEWYGAFPKLTMEIFQNDLTLFRQNGLLLPSADFIKIPDTAKEMDKDFWSVYVRPVLYNQWKYGAAAGVFWERLALLVQCLSFSLAGSGHFIPVTKEKAVLHWLKTIWPSGREAKIQLADTLHVELNSLLDSFKTEDAAILVNKLGGSAKTGLTYSQIAGALGREEEEIIYRFNGILHYIIEVLQQNSSSFPLLAGLLPAVESSIRLTKTAAETKRLLDKGWSFEKISRFRRLKQSTIEDHIIEIASESSSFPLFDYVPAAYSEKIRAVSNTLQTRKMKELKDQFPDEITYFHIRLTLAYYGGKTDESSI
ncbi:uncharacterized protein YpbB [Sinobaca qinghaiensis]|uniref:Uncharacterized protein YpbB n=1 Tax=Sinobaca qinghaiensis TaxID=342944 RepID=A0A419V2Y2_9BACL|nr:helix-turn-helix domain-containing protein [Sinobaca qinghaiensis]RKD72885.1 uncharacterized protein YpbB [Sinobaca qinghaiensis]